MIRSFEVEQQRAEQGREQRDYGREHEHQVAQGLMSEREKLAFDVRRHDARRCPTHVANERKAIQSSIASGQQQALLRADVGGPQGLRLRRQPGARSRGHIQLHRQLARVVRALEHGVSDVSREYQQRARLLRAPVGTMG